MNIDEIIKDLIMTGATIYRQVAVESKQNGEDALNPITVCVEHANGDKTIITIRIKRDV